MAYLKKTHLVTEDVHRQADAERRARVNQALGMSVRCPYAWQLTLEELDQVEARIEAGEPPLPIWTGSSGIQFLSDPFNEAMRRQQRNANEP